MKAGRMSARMPRPSPSNPAMPFCCAAAPRVFTPARPSMPPSTPGLRQAPDCPKTPCRSRPAPTAVLSPPCWRAAGLIDLIIPRGGKALVERVQREARVPVLAHAEGLNHTYIHAASRFRDGAPHPRQRQNAPHRRLRRHRNAAARCRHRPCLAAVAGRGPCRSGLRFPRRCRRPRHPARIARRRRKRISIPNGWMRC